MNKEYLKKVWNSVWDEGLTELEVQRRYFEKLDKELKGEDRYHLMSVYKTIENLEIDEDYIDYIPPDNDDETIDDEENIGCQTGERPEEDNEQLDFRYWKE